MRKKRLLVQAAICCLLLLNGIIASAQTRMVSGKITDATGAPVPGASVVVLGLTGGTTTGLDGVFHLSVPLSAKTLVISFVGYASQRVPITGPELNVTLALSTSSQNEVVVIGYGTQLKKDLTGSVASVNAKDFQQGAITSFDQLIAGKVAGVSITSNGGQPGSASTIRIRGLSSINGNNDPLYVLDGLEFPAATNDVITTTAGINSPLDFLNPDDIENVTVLKDAASAAIYGSRASAGVILITTKKGRSGSPIFNFN